MMTSVESFVAKSLELLGLERDAEIEEARNLQENVSPKELQRRGVCLLNLRVSNQRTGLYGRTLLTFELAKYYGDNNSLPSYNFTPGDIVGLNFSQGDSHNQLLASGIVTSFSQVSVTAAFDDPIEAVSTHDNTLYRLTKLANDVTYRRTKRALESLGRISSSHLIDVLFGGSEPSQPYSLRPTTSPSGLNGDEDGFEFFNQSLDDSQRQAVRFSLSQPEVAVIHGPPGTGKTTTVVELILQAIKQNLKVLACAPSNVAVDNLVEKLGARQAKIVRLGHPARLLKDVYKYSLDAILASDDSAKIVQNVRQDIDKAWSNVKRAKGKGEKSSLRNEVRELRKELKQREQEAIRRVLSGANVVLSTITGAAVEGPIKVLGKDHFDLVVIDECAQALEASCWIALLQGPRCVLAGDHKQLPPTILSNKAAEGGLSVSLMERVIGQHGERVVRMLTRQYRMHAHIMEWSSQQLYQGQLEAHPSVAHHLLSGLPGVGESEDTGIPLLLIDTAGCDLTELELDDEVSKGNEGEADLVAVHVKRLINSGLKPSEIAVIAPYNLQVDLLRLRLSTHYPKLEIKSVDGFQGREKEAVVISLVRSNKKREVGFLAEDRRINVAVTRARRHLALVGDSETVGHHQFLKTLMDYMSQKGEVRSAFQYQQECSIGEVGMRPKHLKFPGKATKSNRDSSGISKTREGARPKSHQTKKAQGQQAAKDSSRPPQGANSKKTGDLDAEQAESRIRHQLEKFVRREKDTLSFPATLSSLERYFVHKASEELGLWHTSIGENEERHVIVRKNDPEQEEVSGRDSARGEKGPQVSLMATSEAVDSDKENQLIASETCQQRNELPRGGKSQPSSEAAEETSPPRRKAVGEISQPSSKAAEETTVTCQFCRRRIPQNNIFLHEINCERQQQQQQQQKSVGRPDSRAHQASATGKRKKIKKRSKKAEQPEDFEALIAEAVAADGRCAQPECAERVSVVGMVCQHCSGRFCLSHHIPEAHGCGLQAKLKARRQVIRDGVLYPGSGVKDTSPDPTTMAHLHRKLDKKLKELSLKRQPKPGK